MYTENNGKNQPPYRMTQAQTLCSYRWIIGTTILIRGHNKLF